MCCFSRPVRAVAATRIFARSLGSTRQLLVYGMSVDLTEELAMVLPVPVLRGAPEDAVRFVDLSGYPGLLDDLARLFPEPQPAAAASGAPSGGRCARN